MTDSRPVAAPAKRGKGLLVSGAVLLVIGIVAIILGIVVTGGTAKELTSTQVGTAQATPVDVTSPLNAATTYAVYQATDAGGTVQPSDITVTAADGFVLTVSKTGDQVVATGAGGTQFVEVATFDVGTSGDFNVKVATTGPSSSVWRLTAVKTGGYVGARIVLGAINSVTSAIVFYLVGMPYWLPLAIWTGVVAQFVPTIGTYIAILLPVLVGALSPNPWLGVIALAWGLLYQQVENLTIEPRISARAVDVNPAVAFGSVLVGSALFGIAGAFLAVPVSAMLLALLETYGTRAERVGDDATVPADDGSRETVAP